jgi:hypothetical protein
MFAFRAELWTILMYRAEQGPGDFRLSWVVLDSQKFGHAFLSLKNALHYLVGLSERQV